MASTCRLPSGLAVAARMVILGYSAAPASNVAPSNRDMVHSAARMRFMAFTPWGYGGKFVYRADKQNRGHFAKKRTF